MLPVRLPVHEVAHAATPECTVRLGRPLERSAVQPDVDRRMLRRSGKRVLDENVDRGPELVRRQAAMLFDVPAD